MTNEIAQQSESNLELLPPAQAPSSQARAMLHEHARMYSDASKLASALVRTTMVPKRFFGKAGDATAAILYGAELGLNPIQSLQRVVAIHGMPSLEARTMVGLLKSRGFKVRTVEQSDKSVTVEGVAPDGEAASSTWTIERAIQAGYVPTPTEGSKRRPEVEDDWVTVTKTWDGKAKKSIVGNMKYVTDPQTMLKAKAQAEVCRELAPDVLMGISYTREDLESEQQDQFDRFDERGAAPARVQPVTVDEIFAEEVPLPDQPAAQHDPETVAMFVDMAKRDPTVLDDLRAMREEREAQAEPATPETPAGDEDQDVAPEAAPATNPSPAVPEPVATSETRSEPEPEQVKAPAKKAPAKKAAADKPKSKLRAPLEKRLFALLGDAGLSSDKDRDGRLAVYRAITKQADVESTDDLDDVTVGKVCDQLYRWQTDNVLDDQIGGILSDAALDEAQSAAPAADPTSEGNE